MLCCYTHKVKRRGKIKGRRRDRLLLAGPYHQTRVKRLQLRSPSFFRKLNDVMKLDKWNAQLTQRPNSCTLPRAFSLNTSFTLINHLKLNLILISLPIQVLHKHDLCNKTRSSQLQLLDNVCLGAGQRATES